MNYFKTTLNFTFRSAEDKQLNPMVQLFYGTFVTERRHEGTGFKTPFWIDVVTVNSVSVTFVFCDGAQVRLYTILSSSVSTPCKSTASTTWMNASKVPWLRRRSNPCIQITVSHLDVRWPVSSCQQQNFSVWIILNQCFWNVNVSVFPLHGRDGSKSCRQSWRLSFLDLNSIPSSAVLRRYTRS